MINKKVVFSGFMAAILFGASANAAQIASKEYVDAKGDTVLQTVSTNLNTNYSTTEQVKSVVDAKGTEVLGAVDTALAGKADKATTYTKTEVDTKVSEVVAGDMADYAKTADVTTGLATKADKTTVGTMTDLTTTAKGTVVGAINEVKAESANALSAAGTASAAATAAVTAAGEAKAAAATNATAIATKANSTDVYTKVEVDSELDKKLDSADLTAYATTDALTTGLATKTNLSNQSNNIKTDSGSTVKYPSVNAVETYALPKPSTACMAESAQCVLAINKADGSIYWENVVGTGN